MKKLLLVLPVISLVAMGCNSSSSSQLTTQQNQPSPQTQSTQNPSSPSTPTPTASDIQNADNAVTTFIDYNKNHSTSNALAMLTTDAQAVVNAHSPTNLTPDKTGYVPDRLGYGLSYFLGIQDSPDKGTLITNSQKANNGTIKVITQWNYSGMSNPVIKTFTLIQENGQWKIEKVQ